MKTGDIITPNIAIFKEGEVRKRFESKIKKKTDITSPNVDTPCWEWIGMTKSHHKIYYGILWNPRIKGKPRKYQYAHRISYILHKGEIPKGLSVCHKCDNGICINPDHLFLGTHKDNMNDMAKKGRAKNQFKDKGDGYCEKCEYIGDKRFCIQHQHSNNWQNKCGHFKQVACLIEDDGVKN